MFATALLSLFAAFPIEVSGPILYLLHNGDTKSACEKYLDYVTESATHDYDLLKMAAINLLEQGAESKDPEIQLLCMFGAGVASSSELLPILAKGVKSADLRTQLVALSYLGKQCDDEADSQLLNALSSPFLITRLEALLQLAKKGHPAVLNHLYSLGVKVPSAVRAAFSQIAIHVEGEEAVRYMHRLLTDCESNVRIAAIQSVAEEKRDDFLPCLTALSSGASPAEQEALAAAFGRLKDHRALARLKELALSKHEPVSLAALIALYELGENSSAEQIGKLAQAGSLFAIQALANIEEGKELLYNLTIHPDRDVRFNAAIALLEHKDRRAIDTIKEILFPDARDLGFWQTTTPGESLFAWKSLSSSTQQSKNYPSLEGETLALRERLLARCIELQETDFLNIASLIFEKRQHALIPLLVQLLENKESTAIIEFLKAGCQRAGAPLIRNYCTLALFHLKVEGPYEKELISWMKGSAAQDLIRFKESKKEPAKLSSCYLLTPEETSCFLIDAFEAIASTQSPQSLELLLHLIAYGNPKNRYALAGLLLRMVE